ncbi:MAG: histidine kinase dimerization/phosphoacceptor domain -containing protein [Euryarchaeota archaeon]|nr:histidine kinase dimerization/phosphoacceptor domain -containing protein [Euryarchaeota archaeon]
MNIRTKFLAVMVSLVLITGMAAILIGRTVSTSIIEEHVSNNLETTAQSRANHIGTVLCEYDQETALLSVERVFRDVVDENKNHTRSMEAVNLRISSAIQAHDAISRIDVMDKTGTVVVSNYTGAKNGENASELFRVENGKIFATNPRTSAFTGDDIIRVATPIIVDGEFSGVIFVDFDAEKIYGVATDRTGLGKTGEIYILNRDGYMITPSRFVDDTLPKRDVDPEHFASTSEAALYTNYHGVNVLRAYAPIPAMDWCLVAEIDEEEAFASVARLTATMFSVFICLLLLGILVCIRVSRTITDPIVKLHRGTDEIMKGNLDYKVGTGTEDEVGKLSRAFDAMTSNLKESGRELAEYSKGLENKVEERTAELDELLEEQKALFSTIPALIYFKDMNGNYIAANKAFADKTGTSVDEIAGKTDYDLFPKEQADAHRAYDHEVMESGEPRYNIEELVTEADGREVWTSTSKTPFFGSGGDVIGMVGMALDITEHKKVEDRIKASLREKEVLLREIHHRVKNNLQVVSSLLNMQARNAMDEETKGILSESRDRITTMSLIHSQLYEGSDLAEINMKEFVDRLLGQLRSYQVGDMRITRVIRVDDYPFPISIAVPVGLIINELLSNALKYAFEGRDEGKIEVSLAASEDGRINLTVSDDGVGLPAGFDIDESKTLGLRLVKILTEDQLQGNLEVTSDGGATFTMEFDIEDDATAGASYD